MRHYVYLYLHLIWNLKALYSKHLLLILKDIWPKKDKLTWERKRQHNEELYNLYPSPNIIWGIKSRMGRAGHVCETGVTHTGFWWGDLRERDHLQDLGIEGRIILQ
jgi:hypothetical protein